jgi:hypothetical protein
MGALAAYSSLALALSAQAGATIWWAGTQNTRLTAVEARVAELLLVPSLGVGLGQGGDQRGGRDEQPGAACHDHLADDRDGEVGLANPRRAKARASAV